VLPHRVVFGLDPIELGVKARRGPDLLQVRPLALDVPEQRLSIQAWPVGVPGLPNCRAIATPAMNSLVVTESICGPLSLIASSSGTCPPSARPCTWSRSPLAIASRSAAVASSSACSGQALGLHAARNAVSTG
jgi:hypothetical protein